MHAKGQQSSTKKTVKCFITVLCFFFQTFFLFFFFFFPKSSKVATALKSVAHIAPNEGKNSPKTCFNPTLKVQCRISRESSPMSCEKIQVLNMHLVFLSYLLSWPPRSSPWSSCGKQQPERWAAPANTPPSPQLPREPPGGMWCSDLKQKGQREWDGKKRENLIIHSRRAKIRVELSPQHPSPLFRHLAILFLRLSCHENRKCSRLLD